VTDPDARVRRLHHLLFQRDPTEAELHLASAFLSDPGTDNWSHYAHALLASNEFLYLD